MICRISAVALVTKFLRDKFVCDSLTFCVFNKWHSSVCSLNIGTKSSCPQLSYREFRKSQVMFFCSDGEGADDVIFYVTGR